MRRVVTKAIVLVLGATTLSACGSESAAAAPVPPGIESDPGFVPMDCSSGAPRWLEGLNPAEARDYLELILLGNPNQTVEVAGSLCSRAADPAGCTEGFQKLKTRSSTGFAFGSGSAKLAGSAG